MVIAAASLLSPVGALVGRAVAVTVPCVEGAVTGADVVGALVDGAGVVDTTGPVGVVVICGSVGRGAGDEVHAATASRTDASAALKLRPQNIAES